MKQTFLKYKSKWLTSNFFCLAFNCFIFTGYTQSDAENTFRKGQTKVSIVGEKFYINDKPTYEGKVWSTTAGEENSIEGLLMNSRMVQGVFDDLNPKTSGQWAYPDTETWDPDRNTDEFVQAMASWRAHGLLGFTLNLQGGCPFGYCNSFPWDNSAFAADGSLRNGFMERTARIVERADDLGMVVILGLFYFGEDDFLQDEKAVKLAVSNATEWVLNNGYTNVILEINNECSVGAYDHDILQCDRVHELINLVKDIDVDGRRLLVSTSLAGGHIPTDNIIETSDFILIHGNGVNDPDRITAISKEIRAKCVYRPKPLVNNEDDIPWRNSDQGWEESGNNFVSSVKSYTGWGFFDFRLKEENREYNEGYQSIPVNWQISSSRKRDFFNLLAKITSSMGTPQLDLKFSDKTGEEIKVKLSGEASVMLIKQFELIVNNTVLSAFSDIPKNIETINFAEEFLDKEHWVKVRLVYELNDDELVVESPYYKNPWWPYGGLKQK